MGRAAASQRQKRRRRIVICVVLALVMVPILLLLGLQRIPSWYQPVDVPAADLTRVQNSLPNAYQQLNAGINGGAAFEFSISARTVAEWVAARGDLYPGARQWLPDWVRDPVVVFADDECIVAARLQRGDWQAIVGLHLRADVTGEQVRVRVTRLTLGAVPVPLSWLDQPLSDLLHEQGLRPEDMPDPLADVVRQLRAADPSGLIAQGVAWPNAFPWRNGQKTVHLLGLEARGGVLRARLEAR